MRKNKYRLCIVAVIVITIIGIIIFEQIEQESFQQPPNTVFVWRDI